MAGSREPFDWAEFRRTLPWQPVPQWVVLSALASPFSKAFPVLTRAVCVPPVRTMFAQTTMVVYTLVVPAVATAVVYLLVGHKRFADPRHRRMANVTLALILALSAADTIVFARAVNQQWDSLGPAYASIRSACWPRRP